MISPNADSDAESNIVNIGNAGNAVVDVLDDGNGDSDEIVVISETHAPSHFQPSLPPAPLSLPSNGHSISRDLTVTKSPMMALPISSSMHSMDPRSLNANHESTQLQHLPPPNLPINRLTSFLPSLVVSQNLAPLTPRIRKRAYTEMEDGSVVIEDDDDDDDNARVPRSLPTFGNASLSKPLLPTYSNRLSLNLPQPTNPADNSGSPDDYVCYGCVSCKISDWLVDPIAHNINNGINQQVRLTVETNSGQTGFGVHLKDEKVAFLNSKAAMCLARLFQVQRTRYEAVIPGIGGSASQTPLDVTLFGVRRHGQFIGEFLAGSKISLYKPANVNPGIPFSNPQHSLPTAMSNHTAPSSIQQSHTLSQAPSLSYSTQHQQQQQQRQYQQPFITHHSPAPNFQQTITTNTVDSAKNQIEAIYQSITGASDLLEATPCDLIRTNLFPHQKQALHWMLGREKLLDMDSPEYRDSESGRLWVKKGNEYQCVITGVSSLTKPSMCRGGIIADDMGLGKSLEVLSLIATADYVGELAKNRGSMFFAPKAKKVNQEGRIISPGTLIVCPLSTISNWETQIENHMQKPTFTSYVYHGPNRIQDAMHLAKFEIVLATYNTIGSEYAKYIRDQKKKTESSLGDFVDDDVHGLRAGTCQRVFWRRIVLDEAHVIKDSGTLQARACFGLVSDRRWCLTGTPIQNRMDDLYSLIKFLNVAPFSDKSIFKGFIMHPLKNKDGVGISRLQTLMKCITLRRTKTQKLNGKPILTLPPRTDETRWLELDSVERRVYNILSMKASQYFEDLKGQGTETIMSNFVHLLEVILRLRQISTHIGLCKNMNLDGLVFAVDSAVNSAMANGSSGDATMDADMRRVMELEVIDVDSMDVDNEDPIEIKSDLGTLEKRESSGEVIDLTMDSDESRESSPIEIGLSHISHPIIELLKVEPEVELLEIEPKIEPPSIVTLSIAPIIELSTTQLRTATSVISKAMATLAAPMSACTPAVTISSSSSTTLSTFAPPVLVKVALTGCASSCPPRELPPISASKADEVFDLLIDAREAFCSYCSLVDFETNDTKVPLVSKCEHLFCKDCVVPHLPFSCPICRFRLRSIEKDFVTLVNKVILEDGSDYEAPEADSSSLQMNSALLNEPAMYSMSSTKIKAITSDLLEIHARNEMEQKAAIAEARMPEVDKCVVFSQWTTMLDILQSHLRKGTIKFCRLDGKMSRDARTAALDALQNDDSVTLMLVSLKAGGVGLNLTRANRIYILEPYWNPSAENQAVDRVHRMGQTKEVTTIRYIVKNTIEEHILALQKRKLELSALSFREEDKPITSKSSDSSFTLDTNPSLRGVRPPKAKNRMPSGPGLQGKEKEVRRKERMLDLEFLFRPVRSTPLPKAPPVSTSSSSSNSPIVPAITPRIHGSDPVILLESSPAASAPKASNLYK